MRRGVVRRGVVRGKQIDNFISLAHDIMGFQCLGLYKNSRIPSFPLPSGITVVKFQGKNSSKYGLGIAQPLRNILRF